MILCCVSFIAVVTFRNLGIEDLGQITRYRGFSQNMMYPLGRLGRKRYPKPLTTLLFPLIKAVQVAHVRPGNGEVFLEK